MQKQYGLLMIMTPLEKFLFHFLKIMRNILECLTQPFHVQMDVIFY